MTLIKDMKPGTMWYWNNGGPSWYGIVMENNNGRSVGMLFCHEDGTEYERVPDYSQIGCIERPLNEEEKAFLLKHLMLRKMLE